MPPSRPALLGTHSLPRSGSIPQAEEEGHYSWPSCTQAYLFPPSLGISRAWCKNPWDIHICLPLSHMPVTHCLFLSATRAGATPR